MGWGEYEGGGLVKVLGVIVILIGVGAGGYEFLLGNRVTALVVFLAFLVLGILMVSGGGYSRKPNTPMGRVEDFSSK